MGLKIGMTYDLRSDYLAEGYREEDVGEFDSDDTIEAIEKSLRRLGHKPERVGNARALCKRLVAGASWDLVFNICEGMKGRSRETQAPAILELYNIPYVFSDPLVCAVTLDKAVCKRIVRDAGLRTPAFVLVSREADLRNLSLKFPVFVKPVAEGTGKGIDARSKVTKQKDLRSLCMELVKRFESPALVEEYLPGREFTVGITGTGSQAKVVGTMEVTVLPCAPDGLYSFETKEKCEEMVKYSRPAVGPLKNRIERLALDSYVALECRDGGRVDVKLDSRGRPSFMEVNPLPGLHPTHSDLPLIATQEGVSYDRLIGAIVNSAIRRIRPALSQRCSRTSLKTGKGS